MRIPVLHLVAALALATALAPGPSADAQTRKSTATRAAAKPKPKPKAPAPPPYVPQERMKTSDDIKQEGVKGAATTPLRDVGIEKTDIPDVLLQALTDPYAKPPRNYGCSYLVALVRPLDDVLGPDIDLTPVSDENLVDRGKVLGVAADVASSALIPFRGVVRKISGAEAHDRLVQSAYIAGSVRRAYLKGLGEARGCMPPATPSHERAGAAPAIPKRELKPKFVTRNSDEPQKPAGKTPPDPQR